MGGSRSGNPSPWRRNPGGHDLARLGDYRWSRERPGPEFTRLTWREVVDVLDAAGLPDHLPATECALRLELAGAWAPRDTVQRAARHRQRREKPMTQPHPDAAAITRQLLDAAAGIDEADRVAIARRCARRCDESYARLQTYERRHQTDRARAEAALTLGYGLAAALLADPTAAHWRTILGLDDRSQP